MTRRRMLIVSLLLTAALLFGSTVPAFAADESTPDALSAYPAIQEAIEAISAISVDGISQDALVDAALRAIAEATGDRWTRYLAPAELTSFMSDVEGGYYGIGVTVESNTLTFVRPGGPADQAGLRVDDVLVAVNGKSVESLDRQALRDELRGGEGTVAELVVLRRGTELTFRVKRAWIELDTVTTNIIGGAEYNLGYNIGYLKISEFSATTPEDVERGIQMMRDANAVDQIIDLRDNPGGLVGAAVAIADMFVDGEKPLVHLYGRAVAGGTITSTPGGRSGRIIVLVNRNTASAAEILAAALKESAGATIVGEQTYGKGRFQYSIPLSNGGAVNITAGLFLSPNGNGIDGKGVTPNIVVADPRFRQVPETPLNPKRPLKQGMVGLDVLALEEQLRYLGYSVGEVDGVFDAKLKAALKAFEKATGATVDGIASVDNQFATLATAPLVPTSDPIYAAGVRAAIGR